MAVLTRRRVPPPTTALIAAIVGTSIAVALDARAGGELYQHLALRPEAVWRGEVWRLLTWPFIQAGPLALILTCVSIFVFGSALCVRWGARRYTRYVAGVLAFAGAGTCLAALAVPMWAWQSHFGGLVLCHALLIAWARQFPDAEVAMYFVLVVRGPAIVAIVIAATLVFALFLGIGWLLPELLAIAAALLVMDRPHRRWWLRLRLLLVRRRLRAV